MPLHALSLSLSLSLSHTHTHTHTHTHWPTHHICLLKCIPSHIQFCAEARKARSRSETWICNLVVYGSSLWLFSDPTSCCVVVPRGQLLPTNYSWCKPHSVYTTTCCTVVWKLPLLSRPSTTEAIITSAHQRIPLRGVGGFTHWTVQLQHLCKSSQKAKARLVLSLFCLFCMYL